MSEATFIVAVLVIAAIVIWKKKRKASGGSSPSVDRVRDPIDHNRRAGDQKVRDTEDDEIPK